MLTRYEPVTITDNYVETKHAVAIYVNGGDGAGYEFEWPDPGEIVVTNNVAISYEQREGRTPVYVTTAQKVKIAENEALMCASRARMAIMYSSP